LHHLYHQYPFFGIVNIIVVMMSSSDAASNQECFAFATNYKYITTPIMVVQVTMRNIINANTPMVNSICFLQASFVANLVLCAF